MPTALTLARLLALIVLMVGVVGTSRAPALDAAALEARAPTVLGDGSCGLEDDEDTLVLCGREVFADLIDTSWLVLPKGQCTDLFGDLSARQLCAFDDPDCDRASPAAPAPPLPQMQVSPSPTPTLLVRADARASASLRAWPPSADDALPPTSVLAPPERPPRGALA